MERGTTNGEADEVLMERFQRGDAAAFDALFERYARPLHAIATNAARDYHRRRHHDPLAEGGELPLALTTEASPPEEPGVQAAVRHALAQLPENQRIAVVLLRFEEMSLAEIAEMLETSEGAVKLRAHRGYERLRDLLHGLWKELTCV